MLLEHAAQLGASGPRVRAMRAIERAAEDACLPPANVDFGLVALAEALDLRPSSALFVFAVGTLAGCVAHILEQRHRRNSCGPVHRRAAL